MSDPHELNEALRGIMAWIADDATAMTFQTLGQYRTAALAMVDGVIKDFAAARREPAVSVSEVTDMLHRLAHFEHNQRATGDGYGAEVLFNAQCLIDRLTTRWAKPAAEPTLPEEPSEAARQVAADTFYRSDAYRIGDIDEAWRLALAAAYRAERRAEEEGS